MKIGINIYLEPYQKELLDDIAEDTGKSKSEVIREAFDKYLLEKDQDQEGEK